MLATYIIMDQNRGNYHANSEILIKSSDLAVECYHQTSFAIKYPWFYHKSSIQICYLELLYLNTLHDHINQSPHRLV